LGARHEKLVGQHGLLQLSKAHIVIFGIGGVGGYVAEALARTFVGKLTLVDCDDVEQSNLNRQIVALSSTLGMPKVEVMKARVLDISPECDVTAKKIFVDADNAASLIEGATYAVDAVDNVTAKLAIVTACQAADIPAISAMGAGNKLAGDFKVTDISKTSGDPLARVIRRELRRRGIDHQKVVCTDSKAMCDIIKGEAIPNISYMPGLCGLVIAGEVVRDIIKEQP
jgi:tRNA A37 threonylcarbamoyladenosine dehydratase